MLTTLRSFDRTHILVAGRIVGGLEFISLPHIFK